MKSSILKITIVACACALCVALTACGGNGGSSSSATSSSSTTTTSSSSAVSSSTTATSSSSEAASSSAAEASESVSAEQVEEEEGEEGTAWTGADDAGDTFYYAESPESDEAILVVLNTETRDAACFAGSMNKPSETKVQIIDYDTKETVAFEKTAAEEEGSIIVDFGDEIKAVLAPCSVDDVVQAYAMVIQSESTSTSGSSSAS